MGPDNQKINPPGWFCGNKKEEEKTSALPQEPEATDSRNNKFFEDRSNNFI